MLIYKKEEDVEEEEEEEDLHIPLEITSSSVMYVKKETMAFLGESRAVYLCLNTWAYERRKFLTILRQLGCCQGTNKRQGR